MTLYTASVLSFAEIERAKTSLEGRKMVEEQKPEWGISHRAGIKPLAKAVEILAQRAVDAAEAFLGGICLPVAKEFGLFLKDKVHAWRTSNIVAIAQKAEQKMSENSIPLGYHAHPRLVSEILSEGGWADDAVVQDLWAGLLSSSCTETGDDDSNLIFTNLLASMTKLEARITCFTCEKSVPYVTRSGLVHGAPISIPIKALVEIAGENDIQRLDRELDHLVEIGLLVPRSGFHPDYDVTNARLTPSPLALHMYVRCQGSRKSPVEFFKRDIVNSCG
jgi:hypothetical protein